MKFERLEWSEFEVKIPKGRYAVFLARDGSVHIEPRQKYGPIDHRLARTMLHFGDFTGPATHTISAGVGQIAVGERTVGND